MMTLGEKQRLFSRLIAELILWANENGYAVTLGDAYRDPRLFGEIGENKGYGRSKSNHKRRLALDLNLFKNVNGNWVYCTKSSDHEALGKKWESMNTMCRWGGRFNDGNHYSLEHEGQQ